MYSNQQLHLEEEGSKTILNGIPKVQWSNQNTVTNSKLQGRKLQIPPNTFRLNHNNEYIIKLISILLDIFFGLCNNSLDLIELDIKKYQSGLIVF